MDLFASVLLPLLLLISHVQATINFTSPIDWPEDLDYNQVPTYKIGDQVRVEWVMTNVTWVELALVEIYPGYNDDYARPSLLLANSSATSYNWTVSLENTTRTLSKGELYMFTFALASVEKNEWETYASPFNITAPGSGKSLSTGAVAGIAVGSTLGGLLILGGLGFLLWKSSHTVREFLAWKKTKKNDSAGQDIDGQNGKSAQDNLLQGDEKRVQIPQTPAPEYTAQVHPQELSSPGTIATELSPDSATPPPQRHPSVKGPQGIYEAP